MPTAQQSTKDARLVEQLAFYADNPVEFVKTEFNVTPDEWQGDTLMAYPHHQRLAMRACVGPGKSACLSWIMLNFMLTRPRVNIAATSITKDNLRDNLWKELAKWISKSPLLSALMVWSNTKVTWKDKKMRDSWMSARTWSRSSSEDEQGLTLAGLHADYIMAIADEAGAMPDAIIATAEGILSSPIEGHLIIAGNPTHLSGPLYNACTKHKDRWCQIRVTGDPDDPKRSPRIDKEWAQHMIETQGGRESSIVRSKVLGLFPLQAHDALIGLDDFEAAYGNETDKTGEPLQRGPRVIGADIARFGNDKSVICVRDGDYIEDFVEWIGNDTMLSAKKIARAALDFGATHIVIDDIGVGGGVTDKLMEMRSDGNLSDIMVIGLNVQRASKKKDRKGNPIYADIKAELNMVVREQKFGKGRISINPKLADTTSFEAEGTDIRYGFRSRGAAVFVIEPKDEFRKRHGGESPNYWDSFILTMWVRQLNLANVGWVA